MKSEKAKLKEVVEKWEKEKPLYKQLPVKYNNGVLFNNLNAQCLCCNGKIEDENMRGAVCEEGSAHLVDAVGWCVECNIFTPYLCRVSAEGGELTLEWHDEKKGWVQKSCQKSLIGKILNWIT